MKIKIHHVALTMDFKHCIVCVRADQLPKPVRGFLPTVHSNGVEVYERSIKVQNGKMPSAKRIDNAVRSIMVAHRRTMERLERERRLLDAVGAYAGREVEVEIAWTPQEDT